MQLSWLWDPGGPDYILLLQPLHQPLQGGLRAAELEAPQGAQQRNHSNSNHNGVSRHHSLLALTSGGAAAPAAQGEQKLKFYKNSNTNYSRTQTIQKTILISRIIRKLQM